MSGNVNVKGKVDLSINLQTEAAKQQMQTLQKQLKAISNIELNAGEAVFKQAKQDITEAAQSAMLLSSSLQSATNPKTGALDFSKFSQTIKASGHELDYYSDKLLKLGSQGKNAYVNLATAVAKSEIPLKRSNQLIDNAWNGIKRTIGWQLSSSLIHGFIGSIQQAVGYAKDLDKSLTDIRIVTGASSDQMAKFAEQANKAAKQLSTTTTNYTKASLIYYQQGLSDSEVKARTETTIKMANATGASAQKVSDQMTAIWNNYDNGTKSLTHYADVMTALGSKTASSTDEIAQGLQKFASISNTVGLSYEYAAAALATVTATSRESADVVGNSFKTLFSRIQGLQLGETLEDGTDLNKYSTALATVGISIKDTSGQLKDMDVILNEMGNSWNTLERDEKMALAQTVAGVRQYTQLMTLMENWDYFKQNLNVANTSAGTLDNQAAIYAESWEAASNRVRTSWEGLWDSLINSDSFITIMDGLSSIVGLAEKLVDGLGGAGGTLATFGGILGRVFTPQIASTVSDVTGFFRQLNPNAREQDRALRQQWLSNMKAPDSMGDYERKVFNQQIKAYTDESFARDERRRFMSAEQIEYDRTLEQQLEDIRERQRKAAALQDRGSKQYDLGRQQLTDKQYLDRIAKTDGISNIQRDFEKKYGLNKNSVMNAGYGIDQAQKYYQKHKSEAEFKGVKEADFLNQFSDIRSGLKTQQNIISNMSAQGIKGTSNAGMIDWATSKVTEFNSLFTKDFWDNIDVGNDGTRTANYAGVKQAIVEQAAKGIMFNTDDIDTIFKPMLEGKGTTEENMSTIRQYAKTVSARGMNNVLQMMGVNTLDPAMIDAINLIVGGAQMSSDGQSQETGTNTAVEHIKQAMAANAAQVRQQQKITGGVELASGAASLVAANQSVITLMDSLSQLGEGAGSLSNVLSSASMLMFNSLNSFRGMQSGMKHLFNLGDKAASGWSLGIMAAVTAITTLVKAIDDNTLSEKERIASLRQSDVELNKAVDTSAELRDNYKTQNELYLDSIEKIKTSKSNPAELVNDVFQANKQAMELISKYGLTQDQYSTNTLGLIEINKELLDGQVENISNANLDLQRAAALSSSVTQQTLLKNNIQDAVDKAVVYSYQNSSYVKDAAASNASYQNSYLKDYYASSSNSAQGSVAQYLFTDKNGKKLKFDEILELYGTEEWDKIKANAKSNNLGQLINDMEKDILKYQEMNNLFDLGVRNNVNSILKNQDYNLRGAESFATLGYDTYQNKYNEIYNKGIFSGKDYSSLTVAQKERIEEYLKSQGYTDIDNIDFKDNQFTYTHGEGQSGTLNVEAMRKWDAEQSAANEVQQIFDDSFDVLTALHKNYGDKAAPGLMSLLTGDNFSEATQKEIDAAMSGINEIQKTFQGVGDWEAYAPKMQEVFGVTTEQFQEIFNVDLSKIHINDWLKQFEGFESSARKLFNKEPILNDWITGEDGKNIGDNLSQNTLTSLYDSFKRASALGGEESGKAMLEGITQILKESGLDESEYNKAMQGLLAIDWSNTLTSAGAAASVIANLGGTLDTTTASWDAFAAAMAAAAGAMPDFSGLIAQLTELAGALQGLSKGNTVSADIRDQLVAMNPEFADLFSKHYSGDYTFIGKDNSVLKEATWDQMLANKGQAGQIAQEYSNYISGNGQGQKDNDDIGRSDFTSHYIPGVGYFVNSTHASQLGKIAGYDFQTQSNILNNYDAAKGILDLWDTGKSTDIGVARRGQNGGFDLYDKETGNWENIVDTTDARYQQILSEFETDQTAYNTSKNIMDTMFGSIHNLDEVSGNWDSEEIESLLSTMDSAKDIFTASTKFDFLRDEHGALNDSALKAIQAMPETSERASAAIDQLVASKENLYRVEQELHDELAKGTMSEEEAEAAMNSAILAYEQAEANAALQSSIDAVAEARGLDAEAVAFYAEQIQNSLSAEDEATLGANNIADMAADLAEQQEAITGLNNEWSKLSQLINQTDMTLDKSKALNSFADYIDKLTNSSLTAGKSVEALNKSWQQFKNMGGDMSKVLKGDIKEITKLSRAFGDMEKKVIKVNKEGKNYGKTYEQMFEQVDNALGKLKNPKEESVLGPEDFMGDPAEQQAAYDDLLDAVYDTLIQEMQDNGGDFEAAAEKVGSQFGVNIGKGVKAGEQAEIGDGSADVVATPTDGDASNLQPEVGEPGEESWISWFCFPSLCGDHFIHVPVPGTATIPAPKSTAPKKSDLALTLRPDAPPKSSGGGGGGGGGGGAKEPKKVAVKRKSETVQRYKQNDYKASVAQKAKTSEERKKDYFYGERKIDQLEKINTLAQKEARITADRIKESREYLVEDRQNLINMLSKYGFEAEFDTDGFLANYERVWNELYEELAALYEDNELTEAEEELEEDINIKMEELEGALEDYENSLKELADDIEAYEESLFEIYDNKIEALEHKVQFKIELEEDDLEYLDFWIDSLGDSVYNAIESIEAMGAKANHLFDGLNVYKQGIEDIYALSDDPFQVWATGGLEDVLTSDQIDLLRDNRDGLADYMQQLIDLREEIKDKVIDTFDLWTERIEANISSIEHYSSVIEYFKNMVDTIGKDPFGLSDQFVNQLEQSAINQSLDYIDSQKTYYESLVEQQAKAQEELDAARARGDESSAEHWEEVVRTTTEAMEEAQDNLLSGLDNTLTLIAEQFETAMQRAVDAFNDAIYAYGGLEGLSTDYDMIRENADLMAADYEKIYELSKLTRDINKVLDDTNIIAGKKKMNSLLKEINELQADGVELSKYDLEYLRAKYELRLAEIELENTQNSKDTVRLSKDSEGNWSYIYTQDENNIEEAEQKYEDALYEMQNLSQNYLNEMSSMMLETSQAMMEEISALRIQDFSSYEEYQSEIKRIQDKYAESLRHQENELNKAVQNSSDLYEQDWQAYNQSTGYKISLAENWVDSFREATLGDILDIDTFMSGFSDTFLSLTDEMSAQLADAAVQYFTNVDTAMKTYGTSIEGFGKTATTTIDNVSQKSKTAKDDLKIMASEMSDAFKEIADYVSEWQEEFSGQIDEMLEEIKTLIQSINDAIRKSAELSGGQSGAEGLIGSAEAIDLLNATGLFGTWSSDGSVGVKVDGKATNFIDYNAALIEEIDDAVARYANAKTGTAEREKLGEELKKLFDRYWDFRDIVNRVYDPTNLTTNMKAPTFTSMDTGGYTGEWGKEGRMAMLHEKELVLNPNDTTNFLDALKISKEVIHSMIEMNARASSMALGDLMPNNIPEWNQTLEQTVTITAEFPSATDRDEIEEAFNNLLNTASQYANRNND